jgi:polysaccharide biosynthesis/export protein
MPREKKMVTAKRLFALFGLFVLTSFAVWGQGKQIAPAVPPAVDPPKGSGAGGQVALPVPKNFIIGYEDVLDISVFGHSEVSGKVTVSSDGKITLPLVGDIQAEGLTRDRLKQQLTEAFADQIVRPEVTVSVMAVNSKKYTMTGKIAKPGVYPLVTPIKIFEAINQAGQFVEFANQKKILVLRGNETLTFNYKDYLNSKERDKLDFDLENGDTVLVK